MTKNFVALRLVIDQLLSIGNNKWLINWLPIDYLLITHWFHWSISYVWLEQSQLPWSGREQTKDKECSLGFSRRSDRGGWRSRDESKECLRRRIVSILKCGFSKEGREGVKWELGFAFFRGWEMGFCALGLGFMKKTIENGNGISILATQGGIVEFELGFEKKQFSGKRD